MPAGKPYTSQLNPDAMNERATPKKKKAMSEAQLAVMRGMVKKSMIPEENAMLRKQMGY